MKEISIVIPVYNSGENLYELHSQICDALQKYSFELIFVNDCSKDTSWDIISELHAKDTRIIGINFRKNFGQDNALLAGIRHTNG